ncbi:MAG: hypothetical protein GWP61_16010, partial [Chloroflexi bacterium]|nr:hypothetical protein [Chloroflexota bacterium]
MIRKLTYLEFPVFLLFAGLVLCSACTERTGIGSEPTEQMPATTLEVPSTSTAAALKSITATTLPLSSPTATVTKTAPAITAMPPTPPPSDKSAVSDDRLATSISKSDDDRWTAEGWLAYIYEEGLLAGYDTKLQVSSADGSLTWTLADYMQNAGLGATIPEILRWSSDGQHAFFTNRAMVDGCGDFVNGSDLFQGNLETGEVVELMPPLARSLSLSPDDSTVAYFPWGPMPDLILRNLATGEERALH